MGQQLWDALLKAGKKFKVTPYGLEGLSALRVEKGHVAGPELTGRTTPYDLGLSGMVSTKKNYIGGVLLQRETFQSDNRLQLVAVKSLDGQRIHAGSQLVSGGSEKPGQSHGNTTSPCFSPAIDCYVSLALLEGGTKRFGENMWAANPVHNQHVAVEIINPHMVDPDGGRMRG